MTGIASIVVLSYNGLDETTRPCIESILRNTPVGTYELILVDNDSKDGTPAYLQSIAARHSHVRLCLNTRNKGYAGGNNDGIRLAAGDFIVLLNNDTLVPEGWLNVLLWLLKEANNIGLVGPVTNSAGNEQRIELDGINEDNFQSLAADYAKRQQGAWFPVEKLGFFCVAMRRAVIERVGYLDEGFGTGMFEDDDYCIRAKAAGFSLAVAEDCFIFHKGSVSFGKLAVETYKALFERNRSLFIEKHGIPWTFTDISFGYWEKINRDLAALKFARQPVDPALERVLLRWENFRHLLVQIHRAELQGQGNLTNVPASTIAARSRWRTRWFYFRRNVIKGSWGERYRYIRYVAGRARYRLRNEATRQELHPLIQTLVATLPKPGNQKVIVFPATVDYSYMRQRPQSLADAFADAGYLVIYGTLNHKSDRVEVARKVRDNLYLVNDKLFIHLAHAVQADQVSYYCLWPNNRKHLDYLPVSRVIYDYMDELALLNLPAEQVEADHQAMLDRADLITVSSDLLLRKIPKAFLAKTLLVNNAVSAEFIERLETDQAPAGELEALGDAPVFGYYGAIAEWLDFELIEVVLSEFPDAYLVLVGEVFKKAKEPLAKLQEAHPHLIVLPSRPQMDLIPLLQRFDICVIPFLKNHITDAVSPVKIYEFLAAGKPVVTTDLHECNLYPGIARCATRGEFLGALADILAEPDRAASVRKTFAGENTWQHRVAAIDHALQRCRQ